MEGPTKLRFLAGSENQVSLPKTASRGLTVVSGDLLRSDGNYSHQAGFLKIGIIYKGFKMNREAMHGSIAT